MIIELMELTVTSEDSPSFFPIARYLNDVHLNGGRKYQKERFERERDSRETDRKLCELFRLELGFVAHYLQRKTGRMLLIKDRTRLS